MQQHPLRRYRETVSFQPQGLCHGILAYTQMRRFDNEARQASDATSDADKVCARLVHACSSRPLIDLLFEGCSRGTPAAAAAAAHKETSHPALDGQRRRCAHVCAAASHVARCRGCAQRRLLRGQRSYLGSCVLLQHAGGLLAVGRGWRCPRAVSSRGATLSSYPTPLPSHTLVTAPYRSACTRSTPCHPLICCLESLAVASFLIFSRCSAVCTRPSTATATPPIVQPPPASK